MAHRKKPIGKEWAKFEKQWELTDHKGKIRLAADHDATYDTAKHWISEGNTDPVVEEPVEVEKPEEIRDALGDIVATRAKVDLDFVGFDLETTNLKADFAIVLCGCIKPFGKESLVFRADSYPAWTEQRANDKDVVTAIAQELGKHAVILTHYGTGFDIRFLRAKMIRYGLAPLPPMFGVDTYSIAKKNMLVSRRRLASLAEYLQLGNKSGVEGNLWMEATMNGNKRAMDEIVAHCLVDVDILENLGRITFPYLKSIRRL